MSEAKFHDSPLANRKCLHKLLPELTNNLRFRTVFFALIVGPDGAAAKF
jgi:hypothetical protein